MAAASAPLLISVGSGRVLLGASFSPTGLPVKAGGGDIDTVVVTGWLGEAVLLEMACLVLEDEV